MFSRLFKRPSPKIEMPAIAPATDLAVIGDVHGRADLLIKTLEDLDTLSVTPVFVGDYVDRGEDSAGVLRLLQGRKDVICLMGNHEDMLLKFLDDPSRHGQRWLRYGGLQTMASFGVSGATETSTPKQFEDARDRLTDSMGSELIDWLRALPSFWQSGNVAVVHAGADPMVAIADQDTQVLRWGHPEFEKTPRPDSIWIAHGHTIVEQPQVQAGRINVDTGAYATGRLTVAVITSDGINFRSIP